MAPVQLQPPILPKALRTLLGRVLHVLPKHASLFLVGGTSRDLLLERPSTDIDLVVSGVPLRTLGKRLKKVGSVARIGERFGVFRVTPPRSPYHLDIALPRTEDSLGTGGYRDFTFRSDPSLPIVDDLRRRDFTVNAIAIEFPSLQVHDPFRGRNDLRRRVLRAVGNPNERFREDYSRILRLLRFAAELGFRIDPATARSARRLAIKLKALTVPREVVAEQLVRAFAADPAGTLERTHDLGILRVLLPEVHALHRCSQNADFHSEGDVFNHTHTALKALMSPAFRRTFKRRRPSATVIVATLLHDIGKPATRSRKQLRNGHRIHFYGHAERGATMVAEIARRLKLDSTGRVDGKTLTWLVRYHLMTDRETIDGMRPTTVEQLFAGERGGSLLQVIWADQSGSLRPSGRPALASFQRLRKRVTSVFHESLGKRTAPPPLVRGNDLKRWFSLPEGPLIGQLLAIARDHQLAGTVRTRTDARALLAKALKKLA